MRADGAACAIAARTAGTRLDPPVRKIVSMAAGFRPASPMQAVAVLCRRSILAPSARLAGGSDLLSVALGLTQMAGRLA